jgi:hypothetical protein
VPYIKQAERDLIDEGGIVYTAGQLNYVITRMVDEYITGHDLSYSTINDIIGALECAKLEAYRRVAAVYEDDKIELNGDVYSEENLP